MNRWSYPLFAIEKMPSTTSFDFCVAGGSDTIYKVNYILTSGSIVVDTAQIVGFEAPITALQVVSPSRGIAVTDDGQIYDFLSATPAVPVGPTSNSFSLYGCVHTSNDYWVMGAQQTILHSCGPINGQWTWTPLVVSLPPTNGTSWCHGTFAGNTHIELVGALNQTMPLWRLDETCGGGGIPNAR
jgi:hypothetical protein